VGPLVLDASVLIGLLHEDDAHHRAAVTAIEGAELASRPLRTPASAYSEALVTLARAGQLRAAADDIEAMAIAVVPLTKSIAERAALARATHDSLRLPDAIVLATARELGAELMTYDQRLARISSTRD
jgi:predicted nucleic acid-binding protein